MSLASPALVRCLVPGSVRAESHYLYLLLEGPFQYARWIRDPSAATVLRGFMASAWASALRKFESAEEYQPHVHVNFGSER